MVDCEGGHLLKRDRRGEREGGRVGEGRERKRTCDKEATTDGGYVTVSVILFALRLF